MTNRIAGLRRLPVPGPDGKPAYVPVGGSGVITAVADALEATALDDAAAVREHAKNVVENPVAARSELRFAGRRLIEALTAVLSVADCMRDRLPDTEPEPDDLDQQ